MDDFLKEINHRTSENSNNRDKALITLASTVIAGTVVFLKDPVKKELFYWLVYSWVAYAVTIVSVIRSFDVSDKALHALADAYQEIKEPMRGQLYRKSDVFFGKLAFWHKTSFVAFMLGTGFLIIFGFLKLKGA